MNWTDSQKTAIEARGGSLLVNAAAGSGKTAVLVERVLRRIIEDGANIDELLVVTFTNAAAAQMKERIASSLEKCIEADKKNTHLLRQKTLLPFARISTIDSLCSSIVRENFHLLDIEPDFAIADEIRLNDMKATAAKEAIEEMYAAQEQDFIMLSELLFRGRDDSHLEETVIKVDDIACSYPDPDEWIHSLYRNYDINKFSGSVWEKLAREQIREKVEVCLAGTETAAEMVTFNEPVAKFYTPVLSVDCAVFKEILELLEKDISWDELRGEVINWLSKLSNSPRLSCSDYEKFYALNTRKSNNDRVKLMFEMLSMSEEECLRDMKYSYPIIKTFSSLLFLYREKLLNMKKAANCYGFSDISTFAIRCLCDKDGNKTDLANEMSQGFVEVLVDEYQDVNDMQNLLFRLLSKDENNLFFVGDSKQSIYKFRQARPRIFIDMKKSRPLYDNGNYPAVVNLDMNFRSRKGITGFVNFLFERIMTGAESEITYDESESLKPGAPYNEKEEPDTEILLLEKNKKNDLSDIDEQGYYLAKYIKDLVARGFEVTDKFGQRPVRYGDICILLRADGGRIGRIAEILRNSSIPVQSGTYGNFFEAPEVQTMLSLLKVIDNPLRDIPLLSLMMSPIYGFTPDDMAKLRIKNRKAPLYTCVKEAAQTDTRFESFISALRVLRLRSVSIPVGELVRQLMDETGYLAISGAMDSGNNRRANLLMLQRLADDFDLTGSGSLSGFLRFLEAVEERGDKLDKASASTSADNAVTIMTIHKSKGLEFPVCILADCSHRFNVSEYAENYVISDDFGMTTARRDHDSFVQYDTLPKKLVTVAGKLSDINEEMRVLYVALTRAKEKLVVLSIVGDAKKKLKDLSLRIAGNGRFLNISQVANYATFILTSTMCHPDAHVFREAAEVSASVIVKCPDRLRTAIVHFDLEEYLRTTPREKEEHVKRYDLSEQLDKKLCYTYPYEELSKVMAKHSASGIKEDGLNLEFFASSRPAFLNESGLTPAQKGTSFHKFMQYADYGNAYESVEKEAERLVTAGYLSDMERDCLDKNKLKKFFTGEIGKRILSADKLYREYRFTVSTKAGVLYPELSEKTADETVIIQGMVDCAFEEGGKLCIVDYKTDKVSESELVARYTQQLKIYKQAMSECTGLPVSEILLYSFHNGTTVSIE